MYKGKLAEGDLDSFSAAEVESMKAICAERRGLLEDKYHALNRLGL